MDKQTTSAWFNKGLVVLAWLIILAGFIGLIRYFFFIDKYTTTNDAQVEQYITPVASRVSGFITEVNFEENQHVKKGDTLLVIDNREFVNKLDMAEADLQAVKSHIAVSEKAISSSKSAIGVQKARLEAAKVQVWKTEQDYKRFQNLLKEQAATQQQFEQVKAAYDSALAQYKTIEQEQGAATTATDETAARIAPVQSSIKEKKASLSNASLYLSYTVVTAPYDGWVSKKNLQVGQLVKEGQTLVNVVSEEKWVTANFRETQLAHLDIGTTVKIKADAYPDQVITGTITSFSPASGSKLSLLPQDNATGNFVKIEQRIPIKIKFNDSHNTSKLRAGMNVVINAENSSIN